ncbi:DNA helicase [Tanacetum coccineum]|uniref:DNA helicase n=1 Tax=Tanacetum coccineum TaxID=301880 RepID=A0ABQ4Z7N4_9ASTR
MGGLGRRGRARAQKAGERAKRAWAQTTSLLKHGSNWAVPNGRVANNGHGYTTGTCSLPETDTKKVTYYITNVIWKHADLGYNYGVIMIPEGLIDSIPEPDKADSQNTFDVNIPDEFYIPDSDAALANLINFIYDQMTLQTPTATDLQKKVIACPKNESADMINAKVLSMLNGQQQVYVSLDEATPHVNDGGETELLYPPEYLNLLNFAGFPPHRLELKVGAPIILLRNLNISGGLCNGTRLIVTQLLNKVIEARIITGTIIPMTEAKDPAMAPVDKGKLPLIEANTVSIADIKPTETNQTIDVRVYRKWVAKNVKTHVASNFCAILLDRKGDAIQANMDLTDLDNFNRQLQLNNAYRISCFKCEPIKIWDRTLPNNTTLLFGKYTSIIPISNTNFPEHYFNFVAYNEVNERADIPGAPLIDYIGCIYRISDPIRSGDATRARRTRRIIDIQNLDGINLPFLIWGDEAENFDMNQYEKMEKPVIIALSSAWATKRYGGVQINATSATHYYLNPNIPEATYIRNV